MWPPMFIGCWQNRLDSQCKIFGGNIVCVKIIPVKPLWDFSLVTDASLQHNRPDITMVLKHTNEVYLIDIAIPGDS